MRQRRGMRVDECPERVPGKRTRGRARVLCRLHGRNRCRYMRCVILCVCRLRAGVCVCVHAFVHECARGLCARACSCACVACRSVTFCYFRLQTRVFHWMGAGGATRRPSACLRPARGRHACRARTSRGRASEACARARSTIVGIAWTRELSALATGAMVTDNASGGRQLVQRRVRAMDRTAEWTAGRCALVEEPILALFMGTAIRWTAIVRCVIAVVAAH